MKRTPILVGTPLTVASDPVVRAAVDLARATGDPLHLLHAYSPPVAYFAAPTGLTTFDPELLESEREMRQSMIDEQLARIGVERAELAGVAVQVGTPHRLLLESARDLDADVLVVGTSQEPHLLGSTTDRVLRKATCPVLVVRAPLTLPARRVLAPVDLSEHAADSLQRGLGLIDRCCGERYPEVLALFVLTEEELHGSSQFTAAQITRLAHDELDRFVERLELGAPHAVTREVRLGEPREQILAELDQVESDLVVLGTHGRGGFERFLLGSVASDIARRAKICSLVIPPPPQVAAES